MAHRLRQPRLRERPALLERPSVSAITMRSFRALKKNTLRGFCNVSFGSLTILDCTVHVHSNGRAWIGLPGKALVDQYGRQRRDANGKLQYTLMAEWRDRATSDKFSAAVLESLKAKYSPMPSMGSLDDGSQPLRLRHGTEQLCGDPFRGLRSDHKARGFSVARCIGRDGAQHQCGDQGRTAVAQTSAVWIIAKPEDQ